ncbi:MAG: ATP-binding protein, partial [Acidobacteriota bacterium]
SWSETVEHESLLMSLRNKLFVSYAVISLLLLGFVFGVVELRVRQQVSEDTLSDLRRTETAFAEHWQGLRQRLAQEGTIVADAPKLKAAVDTADPATIGPVAAGFRDIIGVDLFELLDSEERVLARFAKGQDDFYLKESFPIAVGDSLLGRLVVGYRLDPSFAARMKRLVNAEVAILSEEGLSASTLPRGREAELEALARGGTAFSGNGPRRLKLGGESYLAVVTAGPDLTGPRFLILRSLDESLRFLGAVRRDLLLLALFTTAAALGASYLTARTLTRPLDAIVEGMREMARSGDLTRRIRLQSRDEEASLLAATLNHLTRSLLAFQVEAEHKERLSSLGRLSATLAHEIRNPLTIIKGSALQLLESRRENPRKLLQDEAGEAASDLLQEVDRLNKLLASVLDFARPASFQLQEVNINELCRECLAALKDDPRMRIEVSWDRPLDGVRVDPDRLKQVLLNVLRNAREAVEGQATLRVATRAEASDYVITVLDEGKGIATEDLPNIFDPFFTRKPSGTGLGLSVARNIIEGLGGRIVVRSQEGRGTEVEITLPREPRFSSSPPPASSPEGQM